jgi:hypothetical protein
MLRRARRSAGFLESDRIRTLDLPRGGQWVAIAKDVEIIEEIGTCDHGSVRSRMVLVVLEWLVVQAQQHNFAQYLES